MKHKALIVVCILFGIFGIAAASAALWYHYNFQAVAFQPVQLSPAEKQALENKIGAHPDGPPPAAPAPDKTIVLSEREINGWLQEQGMGDKVKVTLSGGTIAASALLPVDADVPLIGGRTVRFKIALRPRLNGSNHLGLYVSDISVGGISPPNAWLGGIKDRDLLEDVTADPATKAFAQGIKSFDVGSGEVRVVLND